MKRIEVFISGAGIAGLTLACLLAKSGISVAIADPNLPKKIQVPEHGTRTAAVMTSLLPLYKEIGILDEIKGYSAPLKTLKIIDAPSAHFSRPVEHAFEATEIDQDAFSWNIPNNFLVHSLYKRAKKLKNITCLPETRIETFEQTTSGIKIKLTSGKEYISALLVGADGRHSFVRETAGITIKTTELKQTAITAILSHNKPHNSTSTEVHKSGGPFTLVPLPDNTSSLVWVETTQKAESLLRLKKDEITKEIQRLSNNILGEIDLKHKIQSTPLSILEVNSITAPRITLIAEAAHALPPTGAQGLNLSLRDIKALHITLLEAKTIGSDLGSKATLDLYKKAREKDISLRTHSTNILNYFVREDSHIHHAIRRSIFSTLSNISPLRTKIMNKGFK